MRIDAINNFLSNPNAEKIRLNGRYHRLPEPLEFHDSFIPTDIGIGETPFPAPDEQAEAASLSAEIDRLCCSIGSRDSFIIRSFYFAGKSMQEIAEILGLGVSRVDHLRGRALKRMRGSTIIQQLQNEEAW